MTAHDAARSLPDIPALRDLCRSMATLEAVLSPEWSSRCHSFDADWGPGEEMAAMRNGSGDEYSIVFSAAGAHIRGFDHEAAMSPYGNDGPWPGALTQAVVTALNADLTMADLADDLAAARYPTASG
ncbi:hypothetical protein [Nonomuraea sp. NPDC050691]|uniref:hypothetical protein n=1 Tax=Nonomuraea sp. NPDC050691 TaxID=3155661 RepID=UPI0033D0F771